MLNQCGNHSSVCAHRTREVTRIGTGDGLFTSGIDVGQDQHVDHRQLTRKVVQKITGTRVAMWLERKYQTPLRPAVTHRGNHGSEFAWMMRIVVNIN